MFILSYFILYWSLTGLKIIKDNCTGSGRFSSRLFPMEADMILEFTVRLKSLWIWLVSIIVLLGNKDATLKVVTTSLVSLDGSSSTIWPGMNNVASRVVSFTSVKSPSSMRRSDILSPSPVTDMSTEIPSFRLTLDTSRALRWKTE